FRARLVRDRQGKDLVIPLTLVLLLLHVAESGGRRLLWFVAARGWLKSLTLPRLRRRPRRQPAPAPSVGAGKAPGEIPPMPDQSRRTTDDPSLARSSPQDEGGTTPKVSPLERAKKKARNRMARARARGAIAITFTSTPSGVQPPKHGVLESDPDAE